MNKTETPKKPGITAAGEERRAERKEREARSLRENLKRRKQQLQARKDAPEKQ